MNNDLISRETLKNYARKVMYEQNATNFSLIRMFDEIIDNAPSAPLPDFKEGYKQAIVDGQTNFSRPQGEWLNATNEFFNWECSLCHKPNDFKDNFCPNCGAYMGIGNAEQ